MLYKRVCSEQVKVLYFSNRIIIIIRIAINVISHLLFWILIHTENNNYLVLVFLSFSHTIPKLMSSSIFSADKFFVFNGWKYYYSDIDKFKEDALYKIDLCIDGRERIINCFTCRRFNILCDLLRNKNNGLGGGFPRMTSPNSGICEDCLSKERGDLSKYIFRRIGWK